ncbi:flagellar biosynthesis anti-sigma factor FlgM [Aromatoleum sp.]|uniref:flagellar biosynthesis anti-sigma factor FlgM n=1 Tax=Aromatoleum sp. TaxID=2307007 RepID=UPI002FC5E384
MKITGTYGSELPAVAPTTKAAPTDAPAAAQAGAGASGALQSAVLQPALDALRELPAIDHAKVAALRDALARGEIAFDAAKLAGLIERHHGGRG